MRPHHRTCVLIVVVGLVVTACLFATQGGAAIQPPTENALRTPTMRSEAPQIVTLPPSTGGPTATDEQQADEAIIRAVEDAKQAAIEALNAAQAQALADQLQAAADRLTQAAPPRAPQMPTVAVPVAAPCSAPNLALAWIAWCESGCNPTAHNGSSTAAGKYQWLTTSWGGWGGYPTADQAPESAQDQKSLDAYNISGTRPWEASRGCWGGKF